jgi:hypothetical protein
MPHLITHCVFAFLGFLSTILEAPWWHTISRQSKGQLLRDMSRQSKGDQFTSDMRWLINCRSSQRRKARLGQSRYLDRETGHCRSRPSEVSVWRRLCSLLRRSWFSFTAACLISPALRSRQLKVQLPSQCSRISCLCLQLKCVAADETPSQPSS